ARRRRGPPGGRPRRRRGAPGPGARRRGRGGRRRLRARDHLRLGRPWSGRGGRQRRRRRRGAAAAAAPAAAWLSPGAAPRGAGRATLGGGGRAVEEQHPSSRGHGAVLLRFSGSGCFGRGWQRAAAAAAAAERASPEPEEPLWTPDGAGNLTHWCAESRRLFLWQDPLLPSLAGGQRRRRERRCSWARWRSERLARASRASRAPRRQAQGGGRGRHCARGEPHESP
ncbi:unnamed protein product, partial [Prorocentrum cordatum]